jgi:hypothetical protein
LCQLPNDPGLRDAMARAMSPPLHLNRATYDEEIETTSQMLMGYRYTFLHAVTIYPTPPINYTSGYLI